MINANELRLGNYLMQKVGIRIVTTQCTYQHFDLLAKGQGKELFPVVLKAETLERCGFIENKSYPLLPEAREFRMVLPVIGNHQNEIYAYIKTNNECFGRATFNSLPISNNFYHLHQLQNLYFSLTGQEMEVRL
jgi:hypothetical protein